MPLVADTKIVLPDSEIPRSWYNILAEVPHPPQPPLHPGTGQPIGPDDLAPLFPMDLILQEVSTDREIPIPDEVLDVLSLWRPTPLHRAKRLEREIGTA
jgi:tryptophan synthase beta chain